MRWPLTPEQRFQSYCLPPDANGCILWMGTTRKGYGRIRIEGRTWSAHRWAYEREIGSIPTGLVIDHLCRNRGCVNPAHMEPVTSLVNTQRGRVAESNRLRGAAVTHCPQGHPYDAENTRYAVSISRPERNATPIRARICRTCDNRRRLARGRRDAARKRARRAGGIPV